MISKEEQLAGIARDLEEIVKVGYFKDEAARLIHLGAEYNKRLAETKPGLELLKLLCPASSPLTFDIGIGEDKSITELRDTMAKLVSMQKRAIENGENICYSRGSACRHIVNSDSCCRRTEP